MSGYPEIEYDGFDYTELYRTFNIPFEETLFLEKGAPRYNDGDYLENYLIACIVNCRWNAPDRCTKFAAKEIRKYLAALSDMEENIRPDDSKLYKTMSEFESDHTLLTLFAQICRNCWS